MTDALLERDEIADAIASRAGFAKFFVETGQFELVGYRRFSNLASGDVSIYIEGDGLAFLSRDTVSRDPTPRDPVALRLAARDPSANVAWLARPCQYQSSDRLARCSYAYWTDARFAPEVVREMNRAIDAIVAASRAREVRLVGYSGGGVISALVAARRSDVTHLATVGAPLDHRDWTSRKGFTPLARSLDAMEIANRTTTVRQAHFLGEGDSVVPPSAVERFVTAVRAAGGAAELVIVDDADHWCCWQQRWPDLYSAWLR